MLCLGEPNAFPTIRGKSHLNTDNKILRIQSHLRDRELHLWWLQWLLNGAVAKLCTMLSASVDFLFQPALMDCAVSICGLPVPTSTYGHCCQHLWTSCSNQQLWTLLSASVDFLFQPALMDSVVSICGLPVPASTYGLCCQHLWTSCSNQHLWTVLSASVDFLFQPALMDTAVSICGLPVPNRTLWNVLHDPDGNILFSTSQHTKTQTKLSATATAVGVLATYEGVSRSPRTMLITRKSLVVHEFPARVCCGDVLWVSVPSGVVGCGSVWWLHVTLCMYCISRVRFSDIGGMAEVDEQRMCIKFCVILCKMGSETFEMLK